MRLWCGRKRVNGVEELNLCEVPLVVLSDSGAAESGSLVFSDRIYDKGQRKWLHRTAKVTAEGSAGLPNWQDQDVLLAAMLLTNQENRFRKSRVELRVGDLADLLRWPASGRYYARAWESLERWSCMRLSFDHWRRGDKWRQEEFHVLKLVGVKRSKGSDADDVLTVCWDEVVASSFLAGYSKGLDWEFYVGLKLPTSKRLYRFLDKRFGALGSKLPAYDLVTLAREKIGLSRNYSPHEYKRKLWPAIEELEQKEFLCAVSEKKRFARAGPGKYLVQFVKSPSARRRGHKRPAAVLEKKLVERGVTPASARRLVDEHASDVVERQVEVFDWMKGKGQLERVRNTGGFLVSSIRENYRPPPEFEVEAKLRASRFRLEHQERRGKDSARRKEAEQQAQAKARWAVVQQRLSKLDRKRLLEVEEEAVAGATPFLAAMYYRTRASGDTAFEACRRTILERHFLGDARKRTPDISASSGSVAGASRDGPGKTARVAAL